ncbi:MAG: hypothetical protein B6D63_02005 [Candidatus Latescibacteria bacterium 4484_7]|nr:MAG: hypothetical protein B6D63_02005 [Candidatus Latescibacteria bacterium 4484_7]
MNEKVCVIVLNWNGKEVIQPCLDSLLAVRSPELHVIVVDNASTDGSQKIVEERYPSVELIENESNLLFAEGNNVGIRKALEEDADFILILNNDTVVEPDSVEAMMGAMKSNERVGIVGPKILYYDEPNRIWFGGGGFYPVVWVPRHINIRKIDGTFVDERSDTGYVTGCAMLVRRGVFETAGFLDPGYRIYSEDVDFCLRAKQCGWRVIYEPSARIYHKVSSSSGGGLTPFKIQNRVASTIVLHRRFKPLWWRVLLFPIHAVLFAVMLLFLLAKGHSELASAAVRGLKSATARIMGGGPQ